MSKHSGKEWKKPTRDPTGIKDEGKGLETSTTYCSGHVLQQTWQLPWCFVRAVPLSWDVLHALTAPPGFHPSGEAHARNAILLSPVMSEHETAVWVFDSPGSDSSEMVSLHLVQRERVWAWAAMTDWNIKHLNSILEYLRPGGGLDILNTATKNMHLMRVIPMSPSKWQMAWKAKRDAELWRGCLLKNCTLLIPSGQYGRGWG